MAFDGYFSKIYDGTMSSYETMYFNDYGHYKTTSITSGGNKSSSKKDKRSVKSMALKIKKQDEMNIDEFKDCMKAYDNVEIILDAEKCNEMEKDYGYIGLNYYGGTKSEMKIVLKYETIEFLPKALFINNETSVPYELIDKVIGVYHLTTTNE